MFVGVDIGTSSSKGVLVDKTGAIVRRAERAHGVSSPHPGWFEQDAESLWWVDFVAIVRDLVDEDTSIEAVGVSAIGPCLLPADVAGKPLRPGILYGIDTRCTAEVEEMAADLGAAEILAIGGTALNTQALGPRLRWLAKHEPAVFARTRKLLMAGSFLVHRLTGSYVLDHHSASKCNPFYDLQNQSWATDWLSSEAPDLELPELHWPGDIVGYTTDAATAETGLPVGVPVVCGTIDSWAEAASVGVAAPGDTMIMYGTTTFLTQIVRRPGPYENLWAAMGSESGQFLASAGMATSGAVTEWLRRLVDVPFDVLVAEAAEVPPGSRGLLLLPYYEGEWTPIFDADARGVIAGLTTSHTRAELYRAVLEGVAFGVRHNLEALSKVGDDVPRLVAVGGGTKGRLWAQVVSDVTGWPQQLPQETIGACFGDARTAATAVGVDTSGWNPIREVLQPSSETADLYSKFYIHYRSLYESTVTAQHFLAAVQRESAARVGNHP